MNANRMAEKQRLDTTEEANNRKRKIAEKYQKVKNGNFRRNMRRKNMAEKMSKN
jgi:hypothetical protein